LVATHNIGDDVVAEWCYTKACQIPKLFSFLNRLPNERAVEILERFCRTEKFAKVAVADSHFLSDAIFDTIVQDEKGKAAC
jgi:hypothetical protein